MHIWKLGALALTGALTLAACGTTPGGGDDPWDTGDTGWYDGGANTSPQLTGIDWRCSTSDGSWWYYAQTDGWSGIVGLDIFETGSTYPWGEAHDLRNVDYDQAGTWDVWETSLRFVDNAGSQVPSVSTHFRCGYHSDDSLTWMITVYNDENRFSDCAVWGHRPSYWTSERGYRECLNWN